MPWAAGGYQYQEVCTELGAPTTPEKGLGEKRVRAEHPGLRVKDRRWCLTLPCHAVEKDAAFPICRALVVAQMP